MAEADDEAVPVAMAGEASDPFAIVGKELAGKYTVVRELGQGGMGVVYEVVHRPSGERRAAKFIKWYGTRNKEMVIGRFLREARIGVTLRHPGIVTVHEVEWHSDGVTPYIVMELLRGESFGTRLHRTQVLDWREAFTLVMKVCDPLAAAHAAGIVHRDIKPDNIFLTPDGGVKVLDFGIALLADEKRMTQTGMIMGTPQYMAPEQFLSVKDVDGRADIYSLGAMLYRSISGKPVLEAANEMVLAVKIASEEPIDIQRLVPSLPEPVAAVVRAAMVKDPKRRYRDVAAFRAALAAVLAGGRDGVVSTLRSGPEELTVASPSGTAPREAVPEVIAEERKAPQVVAMAATAPPRLPEPAVPVQPPAPPPSRSEIVWLVVALMAVIMIAGGLGGWLMWRRRVMATEEAVKFFPAPPIATTPLAPAPSLPVGVEPVPEPEPASNSEPPAGKHSDGKLTVRVLPFADVYLDGKPLGETPIPARALKPGRYTLEIKNSHLGKSETLQLSVQSGKHIRIQRNWEQ